eukprot:TRINITY_DN1419_c0_g2_i1.p1 TRINITY_DN1419_c0_g2~~TRINITY_DN1419_c0_g2_i1.p1  ORF type:complete len:272 (-),score=63.39 TRINITY_DN1419_c0_g2_i1:353-1168(-)
MDVSGLVSMPNEAAIRRLLRHHPKVHPDSVASAELKALGLGFLPILEWDVEQPWGRYLQEADPLQRPALQEPLSPPSDPFGGRFGVVQAEQPQFGVPDSYRSSIPEPFQVPAAPSAFAGALGQPSVIGPSFQAAPLQGIQAQLVPGVGQAEPGFQVPPIQGFQQLHHEPQPAVERSQQSPAAPGQQTLRLAALEAEEKALLEEVLSLDRKQEAAAGGGAEVIPVSEAKEEEEIVAEDQVPSPPARAQGRPSPPRAGKGQPKRPPRPAPRPS